MKGEEQARKFELKDFRVIVVLMVIDSVLIVAGIVLFLIPQPITCYFLIGCHPKYWGIGSTTCLIGFLFLFAGLKGYLTRTHPDSLVYKKYFTSKRDLKVKKVEEKDDYKNFDWLKHQYYELGKSVQDIANEQGVSMITIRKGIDKLESEKI
ncbi:MAG: hypothetical protein ACXAEX_05095 [Promethearchaeota archaeon]|jgi:hypothetical protein